jgi:hypothetical protein
MSDDQEQVTPWPPRRAADFRTTYANNVFFDLSNFDMKLTFGQIERSPEGVPYIERHSSVVMSWLEAKIAALFFVINIAEHEKSHGIITLPPEIMPPFLGQEDANLPITKMIETAIASRAEMKAKQEPKEPKERKEQ